MSKHQIETDLTEAMKNKDAVRVSTLRMLIAAIRNKEIMLIKKDTGLSDEELLQVLRTEIKQRKEAAEEFKKGGRSDRAENELAEALLIESYLPAELTDKELHDIIEVAMRESGAESQKDFGKAMKAAQARIKGRVPGERVAQAVRGVLRDIFS